MGGPKYSLSLYFFVLRAVFCCLIVANYMSLRSPTHVQASVWRSQQQWPPTPWREFRKIPARATFPTRRSQASIWQYPPAGAPFYVASEIQPPWSSTSFHQAWHSTSAASLGHAPTPSTWHGPRTSWLVMIAGLQKVLVWICESRLNYCNKSTL